MTFQAGGQLRDERPVVVRQLGCRAGLSGSETETWTAVDFEDAREGIHVGDALLVVEREPRNGELVLLADAGTDPYRYRRRMLLRWRRGDRLIRGHGTAGSHPTLLGVCKAMLRDYKRESAHGPF